MKAVNGTTLDPNGPVDLPRRKQSFSKARLDCGLWRFTGQSHEFPALPPRTNTNTSRRSVTPPGLPVVPITKVIAIGHVTDRWTPAAVRTVMPCEVRETVALYLQGKFDQWFMRKDKPGVVFVFNATKVGEVHDLLESLPLGREKMIEFDLIPVGPLAPLALLLSGSTAIKAPKKPRHRGRPRTPEN